MGITDYLSELYESVTSSFTTEAHAEAPEEDEKDTGDAEDDSSGEKEESEDAGEDAADDEAGEEDEEEEEEEEEEEPEDIKPKLEEECARSAQCIGYKHHFDECVERVTSAQENPDPKAPHEDCVEEFFHLQHCATQCAAPKLFKALK